MVILLVLNNYKEGCKPQGDTGDNHLVGYNKLLSMSFILTRHRMPSYSNEVVISPLGPLC